MNEWNEENILGYWELDGMTAVFLEFNEKRSSHKGEKE